MRVFGQWLLVALLRFTIALTKILPYKWRIPSGTWLIVNITRFIPSAKKRIFDNFSKIYPNMDERQKHAQFRAILYHFGQNILELYNIEDFAQGIEHFHPSGSGLDILRAQKMAGKGAICVSGHFGQWEAIRAFMKHEDMQMAGLYKEQSNPYYEEMFGQALRHSGSMYKTGARGMVGLVRFLREGGFISLLHDQRVKNAPLLNFMGQPAHTSLAAAEMALKYNVPLIPTYSVRRQNNFEYDVIFEAPIPPSDAITMTQAMNDSLSKMVRQHPNQWYWLHDRWWLY